MSALVDTGEADLGLADIIEESMLLLGAGSTVLYQLALLGVGPRRRGAQHHADPPGRPAAHHAHLRLRDDQGHAGGARRRRADGQQDARARAWRGLHGLRPRPPAVGGRDPRAQRRSSSTRRSTARCRRRPRSGSTATRRSSAPRCRCAPRTGRATYADFEKYWDHMLTTQLSSEPLVRDYVRKLLSSQGPAVVPPPAAAACRR